MVLDRCELDPTLLRGFDGGDAGPCSGPASEYRLHSTIDPQTGEVVLLARPGLWGRRCERHGRFVDMRLNERRDATR